MHLVVSTEKMDFNTSISFGGPIHGLEKFKTTLLNPYLALECLEMKFQKR
jgi:hypothetical protein